MICCKSPSPRPAIWATNPLIHTLGFLTRNAIVTALVVPLMAYLVMPPLAKLASAWLRRRTAFELQVGAQKRL